MAGQSAGKVKYREITNQNQGRSGSKVPIKPGPAKGQRSRMGVNPTKKGGVFRPTKGGKSY